MLCSESGTKLKKTSPDRVTMVAIEAYVITGETLDIATVLGELKKQKRELERAIAALEEIKPSRRRTAKPRSRRPGDRIVSIARGRETVVSSAAAHREKRKAEVFEFPVARRVR